MSAGTSLTTSALNGNGGIFESYRGNFQVSMEGVTSLCEEVSAPLLCRDLNYITLLKIS